MGHVRGFFVGNAGVGRVKEMNGVGNVMAWAWALSGSMLETILKV
jgi:hypothetical protein